MPRELKTLRVGGEQFRCTCGGSVFYQPRPSNPTIYECNACRAWYRSENDDR